MHPIPTFAPIQETGKTDDFINSIEKFSDDITDFIKSRDEKLGFTNKSGMKPPNALVRELSNDNWHYFNSASRRGKTLSPDEKSNNKQVSALKSPQTKQTLHSFVTHEAKSKQMKLRNMQTEDATYSYEPSLNATDKKILQLELKVDELKIVQYNRSSDKFGAR